MIFLAVTLGFFAEQVRESVAQIYEGTSAVQRIVISRSFLK
jgi:hypothetical protein